jgi:hypothetical protein
MPGRWQRCDRFGAADRSCWLESSELRVDGAAGLAAAQVFETAATFNRR